MLHRPTSEDHETGELGPHIHDGATVLFIISGKRAFGRRERLEHHTLDAQPGAVHGLYKILPPRTGTDHDVNERFQTRPGHPDRFGYSVLPVNDKFLRKSIYDL